jgi:hypothetical protein
MGDIVALGWSLYLCVRSFREERDRAETSLSAADPEWREGYEDGVFGAMKQPKHPERYRLGYGIGLVHLVGIGDSVGAAPANRVAFATVAPKTWSRRKSAIGMNRVAVRSILST